MFLTKFVVIFSICGRTALGLGDIFKWEPSKNETQTLEDQKWTVIKDKNGKSHVILLQDFQALKQIWINENYDVKFYLYRRDHRDEAKEVGIGDFIALGNLNWKPENPIKIIVHGYGVDYMSEGMQIIKERLLDSSDANVILVDWQKQASYLRFYPYSAGSTKDVGKSLSDFINFLLESESNLKNIHLIGHSLGAHVCGFAGYFTKQTTGSIARITGLDPALPSFENTEATERLDASDADFVDCIHTCGRFLGIQDPICTADFYPNGGTSVQPGCHWYDFGICSHSRSHELFAESVIPNHIFPAFTCPNVADQSAVDCKNEGALMGYPAQNNFHGIFYLQTNEEFPFSPRF